MDPAYLALMLAAGAALLSLIPFGKYEKHGRVIRIISAIVIVLGACFAAFDKYNEGKDKKLQADKFKDSIADIVHKSDSTSAQEYMRRLERLSISLAIQGVIYKNGILHTDSAVVNASPPPALVIPPDEIQVLKTGDSTFAFAIPMINSGTKTAISIYAKAYFIRYEQDKPVLIDRNPKYYLNNSKYPPTSPKQLTPKVRADLYGLSPTFEQDKKSLVVTMKYVDGSTGKTQKNIIVIHYLPEIEKWVTEISESDNERFIKKLKIKIP